MKTRSILPLLLAMLLAATSFAGCAGDTAETTADTPADTAADTTSAVTETETTRYAADLPMQDFGGANFNFLKRFTETAWSVNDLFVEEQNGEKINDAVYDRQIWMEETYNLTLTATESGNDNVLELAKTYVTAGDASIHAIATSVYDMVSLSLEGMLYDLNTVENIDLSQPWWSQNMNKAVTIGGKQHYAMGDIFIVDNEAERIYYFNKAMAENLGLGNLYDVVREGKWTIDTMMSYAELAANDTDGDGTMTREYDQWGVMAQPQHFGFGLYMGAGQKLVNKDDKDMPFFQAGEASAIDMMTVISDKISGSAAVSLNNENTMDVQLSDNIIYFQEGRILFAPEVLLHIATMRNSDVDVGILPNPKFDEAQTDYYCYADGYCTNGICIPVSNTDTASIGYVLEAMSAESKNGLTEAYFEVCLSSKYVRDADSVEMLNLVLDSGTLDLGELFRWSSIVDTVSNAINSGESIASTIASAESAVVSAMEKDVKALLGE